MAETFSWNLSGLDRRHFTAFANLLSLRNGGQVEPASLPHDLLDRENPEDDDADSIDTSVPQMISNSGYEKLKKKFLDCLAEFAANKKGGRFVACSAMREGEESVSLWITRNEGFQSTENNFFNKIAELLSSISCNESRRLDEELWKHMLAYHEQRLESSYIPNLRTSFKDWESHFNADDHENIVTALHELRDLRRLTFDVARSQSLIDRHSELVTKAYEVRRAKTIEELLQTSPQSTPQARKLWENICFLSRLRVAFEKFKKTALEIQSFRKVTIHLVPREITLQNSPEKALSLRQVFELLKLPFNSSAIKTVVGQSWSITKTEQEFAKRQKQKLNIHAEVQMILFFSRDEESFKDLFLYFGCSKPSCFMCSHFLQAHGRFGTRGCHGRVFKPWTVPEASQLAPGQANRIAKAVMQLQKDLKKELKSELKKSIQQVKTSVIGGSSVFTERTAQGPGRQSELKRRVFKAEQERVAEMFRRQSLDETRSAIENPATTNLPGDDSPIFDECDVCSQMTSRHCSVCGKDSFCSQSCEDKRSGLHIFECTKRPLTTADYLYQSIGADELPEEEDVLEDFGFNHLSSFADKCKLLGLYKGLYLSDKIDVEDVHKWRVEGSLVTNIKNHFYKIPENRRGGYFPWFLNHTDIFDRKITNKEANQKMADTFYDEARTYLDEEDRHKKPNELKPDAKREAYYFMAEVLHMASPNPVEDNYRNFGFCTCSNEWEERSLGGLFQRLLLGDKLFSDVPSGIQFWDIEKFETATFTEFWKAYESGSLIQLMDSKGLGKYRTEFPFLEGFLSIPPSDPHISVWSLKQFIAANNPADFPPHPAVEIDYGFMNCRTFEETCILVEIYRRLLSKASPLELHKACLEGKMFEFAQRFHRMDENHRKLMKNICYEMNSLCK